MFLALAPAFAGKSLDRIAKTGKVVIANREASIPFSYAADGCPVGYSIDICRGIVKGIKAALKRHDLRIEFFPVTSEARIPAIKDAKADLACGSTTNNAERRKQVGFTTPHSIAGSRTLSSLLRDSLRYSCDKVADGFRARYRNIERLQEHSK